MSYYQTSEDLPNLFLSNPNFNEQEDTQYNKQRITNKNSMFFIHISLNKQSIVKNQTVIQGVVSLKPLVQMKNVPVKISMTGWSSCVINQCQKSIAQIDQKWREVQIQNTVQNILPQFEQKQSRFNSSAFLQEPSQIDKKKQNFLLQTFLEGEQTIYQLDQNSSQRLTSLVIQNTYAYPFSFTIPKNMPISMNKQVLKGVHMIVQYWIKVEADTQLQKNFLLKKRFQIISDIKQYSIQVLSNQIKFKCFHSNGCTKQVEVKPTFCQKINKCILQMCQYLKPTQNNQVNKQLQEHSFSKYDLYHCQIIVTVNQNKNLHITARVYSQPNEEQLKIFKQKIGNSYLCKEKPILLEDKTHSNSKIQKQSETLPVQLKADYVHVKMIGSVASIKNVIVFQRDIQLSKIDYDMDEGEIIIAIQKNYHSEKNQLFELKFQVLCEIYFKNLKITGNKEGGQGDFKGQVQERDKKAYHIDIISEKKCQVPL